MDAIAHLIRHTRREPHQAVFEQGDPSHSWFWLCQGRVRLTRRAANGRRQILSDVQPGQPFGVEALVREPIYDKSAEVVSVSRIVSIPTHVLPSELLKRPPAMKEICQSFVRQAMDREQRLKDILTNGTRERVVSTLINLADGSTAAPDSGPATRAVRATNDDLAAMAGTTPQTVSSCLSRLQRRGLIERRRGAIELLNVNALAELINLS